MKKDAFNILECPVCKKQFVPAEFHAYKIHIKNRTKKVCSYHCLREYQKGKEK